MQILKNNSEPVENQKSLHEWLAAQPRFPGRLLRYKIQIPSMKAANERQGCRTLSLSKKEECVCDSATD